MKPNPKKTARSSKNMKNQAPRQNKRREGIYGVTTNGRQQHGSIMIQGALPALSYGGNKQKTATPNTGWKEELLGLAAQKTSSSQSTR